MSAVRQFSVVCKTILKQLKNIVVPFGVISTGLLFATFQSAKANSLTDAIFMKKGVLTKVSDNVTNNGIVDTWDKIGSALLNMINWMIHFKENIAQLSVNLLTDIYELLMLVLQTPLFIFNNGYIKDITMTFSGISILIVTVLTMIEGILRMFKKGRTGIRDISSRWSIATIISGASPFLFEKTFAFLNMVSKAISQIGGSEIRSADVMNQLKLSGFDTIALIGFDLIILALMIPLILQNGRRFWDLMCLAAITPLAMSAWVFPKHKHKFDLWWSNVKKLSLVQLVYSTFICLMGVFIFGTRNVVDSGGMFLRSIIVIGGLYRMVNPPQIIRQMIDQGGDIEDMGSSMWKTAKSVYDTVTLKNVKTLGMIKKHNQNKTKKISSLRKKYGKRYVGNLI
jgi:hypothetical protein